MRDEKAPGGQLRLFGNNSWKTVHAHALEGPLPRFMDSTGENGILTARGEGAGEGKNLFLNFLNKATFYNRFQQLCFQRNCSPIVETKDGLYNSYLKRNANVQLT